MKKDDRLQDKIQNALDTAEERVRDRNKDFVSVVTGEEGNGKSSLAMLMADYVDPDFDAEEQICMDHEDFIRTADRLDPFQAIVLDEGIEALLSRNHGQKKNKMMIEWFREVRAKNLFIFICMPEFKEVEKPVRDDRAHVLVKCVQQGWAHFFSKTDLDQIQVDRRGNRVRAEFPDPTFKGGWRDPAGLPIWEKYKSMKRQNVDNLAKKYLGAGEDDGGNKWKRKAKRIRTKIAKTMTEDLGMTQAETANRMDVTPAAISKWKRHGNWDEVSSYDLD